MRARRSTTGTDDRAARRVAFGVGAIGAAAAFVHVAPAASSWRQARCLLTPRLAGVGADGHVALTFDDGPDPVSTPAFLDALDRLDWRATFFVLGSQVRKAGDLTREIAERGHEVGVHGDRHTSHLRRPMGWTTRDVTSARDIIAETTGISPTWFRPPYGALAASSLVAARSAGLRTVLWTCWGRDWRADATAESVTATVEAGRRPGATVLLHDSDVTSSPGSWKSALDALPRLATRWRAEGLTVGTLSEHGIPAGRATPAP